MSRMSDIKLVLTVSMAFALALFLPALGIAGDLEPSGTPGPTMHTLDEIYGLLSSKQLIVQKTGQQISYAPGDDGNLQIGVPSPTPRFTDNGDGTVTDNLTRLMWMKNANLFHFGETWYAALAECNGLSLANHDDWRLPNVKELQSLIDYGNFGPALPSWYPFEPVPLVGGATLTCSGETRFWTSTTSIYDPTIAWTVEFELGTVEMSSGNEAFYKAQAEECVWCVRGGTQ